MYQGPAKKLRVNEASESQHDASGLGNSTKKGCRSEVIQENAPDNIDGADLTEQLQDNDHNYSVTNRWRKRCKKLADWMDANVKVDIVGLGKLRQLAGEELFVKIDKSSPFGIYLLAFDNSLKDHEASFPGLFEQMKKEIKDTNNEMNELKKETEDLKNEIESKHEEIRNNVEEIQALETLKRTLASTEIPNGEQSRVQQLSADPLAEKTKTRSQEEKSVTESIVMINEELIKRNEELIKGQEELINCKEESIKGKEESIKCKEKLIKCNDVLIQGNERTVKHIEEKMKKAEIHDIKNKTTAFEVPYVRSEAEVVRRFMDQVCWRHRDVRFIFLHISRMAYESSGDTSTMPSVDGRIDLGRLPLYY
jgi:hypothetical protein